MNSSKSLSPASFFASRRAAAFGLALALAGGWDAPVYAARPVALSIGKFRGAWDDKTGYDAGQVVTYGGVSYLSLHKKNLGRPPANNPADWSALSAPGSVGPAGRDGRDGKDGKNGAKGDPGASFNPLRVAMKRWYGASQTGLRYSAGDGPTAAAFDGTFLWIADRNGASLVKLRPGDGAIVATYSLDGAQPGDVLFDGGYIWTATTRGLLQIGVSDGAVVRAAPIPATAIAFDGEYVWAAGKNGVYKVKSADGGVQGPFDAGEEPTGIVFDGKAMWVGSAPDSTVFKLDATGKIERAIHWEDGNLKSMVFDGTAIWVLKSDEKGLVTKVNVADAFTVGNFPAGRRPTGIAFDGSHIWVSSPEDRTVFKFNIGDGSTAASYKLDADVSPYALAFDGAAVWILSQDTDLAVKY